MLTALYIYLGLTHVLIPIILCIGAIIVFYKMTREEKRFKYITPYTREEKEKFFLQWVLYLIVSLVFGSILTPVAIVILIGLFSLRNSE